MPIQLSSTLEVRRGASPTLELTIPVSALASGSALQAAIDGAIAAHQPPLNGTLAITGAVLVQRVGPPVSQMFSIPVDGVDGADCVAQVVTFLNNQSPPVTADELAEAQGTAAA